MFLMHNKTCTMEPREQYLITQFPVPMLVKRETRVLIVFGMRTPSQLNTSKCSCINEPQIHSHPSDHEILIAFLLLIIKIA